MEDSQDTLTRLNNRVHCDVCKDARMTGQTEPIHELTFTPGDEETYSPPQAIFECPRCKQIYAMGFGYSFQNSDSLRKRCGKHDDVFLFRDENGDWFCPVDLESQIQD